MRALITGDPHHQLVRFSADEGRDQSNQRLRRLAKPGSPHYTSQMELFVNQQLKPMTLDKEQVLKNAEAGELVHSIKRLFSSLLL